MSNSPPPSHQPIPLASSQASAESYAPRKHSSSSVGDRRKGVGSVEAGNPSSLTSNLIKPRPPPPTTAAEPIRQTIDPWSSSSTGHQRSDNRLTGSTSWRASRSLKLSNQFGGGASGGKRMYDT
ncbi:MAG: hypothetical protein Q9187_005516, partial [Circinaria calcarea]